MPSYQNGYVNLQVLQITKPNIIMSNLKNNKYLFSHIKKPVSLNVFFLKRPNFIILKW